MKEQAISDNTTGHAGNTGVHCLVSGLVQGVGFRYATVSEARHLGLRGWVRNLEDGKVETEAFGDPAALDSFCKWLEHGSRLARVSSVQVNPVTVSANPEERQEIPEGFVIKPDATDPCRPG